MNLTALQTAIQNKLGVDAVVTYGSPTATQHADHVARQVHALIPDGARAKRMNFQVVTRTTDDESWAVGVDVTSVEHRMATYHRLLAVEMNDLHAAGTVKSVRLLEEHLTPSSVVEAVLANDTVVTRRYRLNAAGDALEFDTLP